jgi:O-methyltransferase involved in polyketide biosynthesis
MKKYRSKLTMESEKVHIMKEKETYLPTVYGKALDNRSDNPILGDKYADEAIRKIDFDFDMIYVKGSEISVPVRAKHLDGWTREFLLANHDSIVLHLGCGLDSRVFRIDPPATVRWYDVDFTDVIAIRRKIYPDRHDYQLIGSDVTGPHWLDRIAGDRPVLVIAEGLMNYLSEQEVVDLFSRVTEKFPSGDIIFDASSSLMNRGLNFVLARKKAGFSLRWGLDDPHMLEKQVPRLRLIDAVPFLTMPELTERLSAWSLYQRIVNGILGHFGFYQRMLRHCRYRFP